MRRIAFSAIAFASVTGCVAEPPIDQLSHTELKALAEQIVVSCEAQGVKRDTPEMDACFRTESAREVARRDRAASIGPAIAAGMSSYGASQQRAASTYRAPVRCTSSQVGGYVNTTCY